MTDEPRPKPLFYVVLAAVVLALLGYAFRNTLFPKGKGSGTNFTISKEELAKGGTEGVEGADANVPTR